MKLWREIEGPDDLDTGREAYTAGGDAGGWFMWKFSARQSLWHTPMVPEMAGLTGAQLIGSRTQWGPLLQEFRKPLPLVPEFGEPIIGEHAVTEPEIRARALDAAVKLLGSIDTPHVAGVSHEEWAADVARIYTTAARALEPYLRGRTEHEERFFVRPGDAAGAEGTDDDRS